jgi:hypothetical protein
VPKHTQIGGRNSDREFVRLRGRMSVEDPAEKAKRRAEFEAYRRQLRIRELEALVEEDRALAASGGQLEERAS